ncbi:MULTISPECIES: alpha/beta hydrolase fold domain-containing protein [Williamsia]|uniref:alpha/beta hydrolase fold domain-containing protein n=1 Tax=Williamsia TaxID=85043 RepID=UPI0011C39E8A|nr:MULTISPECIES: alpha/beta hydrolase [Williamsia]
MGSLRKGLSMVSWQARAQIAWMRLQRKNRFYADPQVMRERLGRHQDPRRAQPPRSVAAALTVDRTVVDGHDCFTLSPTHGPRTTLHIFHLHGGGFVEQPDTQHWSFARRMVELLGCRYTLPMYPLCPAADHRTIVPMVGDAYAHTMAGTDPGHRVVIGDSAGGALALDLAIDLRERRLPQPAAIALFSPWLNLPTDAPESLRIAPSDPELGIDGLRQAARWYAADTDFHDVAVRPVDADLSGLAPLIVFIGTRDILLPDARLLQARARQHRTPLDLHIYDGMFHNWIQHELPESHTATDTLVDFITSRVF